MNNASMTPKAVYLASASPRRRSLLRQLGVEFAVVGAAVDERVVEGEAPVDYALRVASDKALRGLANVRRRKRPHRPVLAADTTVVLDGEILGKPSGPAEAAAMLRRLSGRTHEVISAVVLHDGERLHTAISRSSVVFAPLDDSVIERYAASDEPRGKAGAYAIQGRAAAFITRLEGSYSGVMGLPLHEVATLLQRVDREAL